MGITIMIAQLMLSLSILIVLHELGHFLPARWFKTRVEKFYLFFDPWFSLFKYKKGDTEYGIGWLPLGGYVKISGMIDESMDTEQMKQPPQPWEFRSKPAWQRLIIMLGGVTVNFLLGFLIYGLYLFTWGEAYTPNSEIRYGIFVDSIGLDMGLRDGDNILSIGDKPFVKFNDRELIRGVVFDGAKTVTVERNGQSVQLDIDPKFTKILTSYRNKDKNIFGPRFPSVVADIPKDSPAKTAGLMPGDSIIALNGTSPVFYHTFYDEIPKFKNKTVDLLVVRNVKDTLDLTLPVSDKGKINAFFYGPDRFFKSEKETYTLAEALPAGVTKGLAFLGLQLKAFGKMFSGDINPNDSLGGFASIGQMFGTEWNWERFWYMTAILSLILAFMNLLPIPALDGGHVMFLIYEVVSGRKPSDKFMEIATMVGFVLVLGLVLYANGLDLFRWIFK